MCCNEATPTISAHSHGRKISIGSYKKEKQKKQRTKTSGLRKGQYKIELATTSLTLNNTLGKT